MKCFNHRNVNKEFANMISGALVLRTEDDIWEITRMKKQLKPVQMNRFCSWLKTISKDREVVREVIMDNLTHDDGITNDSAKMLVDDLIDIIDFMSNHDGKAYLVKVLIHPQMVVRLIPVQAINEEEIKASFWDAMHRTPVF